MYDYLVSRPRWVKRTILLALDLMLVPVSLYCAIALRFGTPLPLEHIQQSALLFPILTVLAAPVIMLFGLHRIKLIAFEMQDVRQAALAAGVLMLVAIVVSYLLGLNGPRSVPLIFGPVFLMSHIFARIGTRAGMLSLGESPHSRMGVAIYGAGVAGGQVLAMLRQDNKMRPMVFVDDNTTLQRMTVSGLKVVSRKGLEQLVQADKVHRILLALPSISEGERRRIVQELSALKCEVFSLPSLSEVMQDGILADKLRPVTPDMLLGRDKVTLDIPEVTRVYAGRSVMVTGAGGSIGSELCRQIIGCNPSRIVLFEQCEYALYTIHRELGHAAAEAGVEIVARLGSVCDKLRVARVLAETEVEIVLHAAAYKHVPLVEENEVEGVRNNVLGTHVIAEASMAAGVKRFILVSTDKAVRPTNIMGASKRLAEMVIQDLQTRSTTTKFAMVRFGNVLGSSGSVIPLFQHQIKTGGPLTITHEGITRYFMTIPEAVRLVLLAGSFATGGDVFVLDMGEPVNIRDLAERMIKLSGLDVRDASNPKGDIEIKTIGLRPGEKLYEELLIGDNTLPTPHPKIMRAQESVVSQLEMAKVLQDLRKSVESGDPRGVRAIVTSWVEGYHTQSEEIPKTTA